MPSWLAATGCWSTWTTGGRCFLLASGSFLSQKRVLPTYFLPEALRRNESPNFFIKLASADKMHWEEQFGDYPTESNHKNMSRPVAFRQTEPSHWAAGAGSVLRPQMCWGQFYLFNTVISSHLIHSASRCFHVLHPQMNPNCPQSVAVNSRYICHEVGQTALPGFS